MYLLHESIHDGIGKCGFIDIVKPSVGRHCATGNCEVIIVEFLPCLSSISCNNESLVEVSRTCKPQSSKIRRFIFSSLANYLIIEPSVGRHRPWRIEVFVRVWALKSKQLYTPFDNLGSPAPKRYSFCRILLLL